MSVANTSPRSLGAQPDALARVIERAKRELQHMIDVAPQAMVLVDRGGWVVRASKPVLSLGGLSEFTEVLGRQVWEVFRCEEPAFFRDLLAAPTPHATREARVRCGQGLVREFEFTVIAPGSESDFFVIMASDVTGEKERLASLEKKHKRQAATALVAGLKHTINQTLTVIEVTAKLAHMAVEKGTANAEEMKKHLETIMDLTMQVAEVLEQAEKPENLNTVPYPGNVEIVDLPRLIIPMP